MSDIAVLEADVARLERDLAAAFERNTAQNERDDALDENDRLTKAMPDEGTVENYEDALWRVRYWLHDGLFLKKPIEPPQRILRVVERALGVG